MATLSGQVQEILNSFVQPPTGVAGLVFGAIDRDGNILVSEAAGKRSLSKPEPLTLDTLFTIYSMTKFITGIAAMKLVEQGKLVLDDPIETVISELADIQIMSEGGGLRAPKTKVTLRMLLTHTSGFAYPFDHATLFELSKKRGYDGFSGKKDEFLNWPLIAEPGTEYNYGISIDWVGEAVARVSGQTLGDFCRDNIFKPLGINGISWTLTPEGRARLADLHHRLADGSGAVRDHLDMHNVPEPYHSGGGGAYADLHSYLSVATMVLRNGVGANGARILKEETVAEMFRSQLDHLPGILDTRATMFRADLSRNDLPLIPIPKAYGLTFMMFKTPLPTGRSAGTAFWSGLTNGQWLIDREKGVAMAMLCSMIPFGDPAAFSAFMALESAVYKSLA
ncbi:beta-lactamase/transpeptidase-like protein [Auricularia subglabra TFB-10046 SS5]|nr:beta-lactamase/transpeptidase-like protein [Auricularia subglabra TFB-10046 SS5]